MKRLISIVLLVGLVLSGCEFRFPWDKKEFNLEEMKFKEIAKEAWGMLDKYMPKPLKKKISNEVAYLLKEDTTQDFYKIFEDTKRKYTSLSKYDLGVIMTPFDTKVHPIALYNSGKINQKIIGKEKELAAKVYDLMKTMEKEDVMDEERLSDRILKLIKRELLLQEEFFEVVIFEKE